MLQTITCLVNKAGEKQSFEIRTRNTERISTDDQDKNFIASVGVIGECAKTTGDETFVSESANVKSTNPRR